MFYFELPEPISGIIKNLGLDGGDDLENNSFSKNVAIESKLNKKELVNFIKESVYQNSGVESRDILNDWYEIKKVEIRDIKISNLGI